MSQGREESQQTVRSTGDKWSTVPPGECGASQPWEMGRKLGTYPCLWPPWLPGTLTLQAINSLALCSTCCALFAGVIKVLRPLEAHQHSQQEASGKRRKWNQHGTKCIYPSLVELSFTYFALCCYLLKKGVICPLEFLYSRWGSLHPHGVV